MKKYHNMYIKKSHLSKNMILRIINRIICLLKKTYNLFNFKIQLVTLKTQVPLHLFQSFQSI